MPLARTHSVALIGVNGQVVEVEADITNGLVGMILIGLPDTALREARDRIRAAIANSGEEWPQRKITVGLSPASLPKRGSWFDLAIAIGILAAAAKVPRAAVEKVMFFGELGLDGQLRPVRGVLPAVAAAVDAGFGTVMVAEQNAAEAALVPGVHVIAACSLTAAADWRAVMNSRIAGSEVRGAPSAARHPTAPLSSMAVPVEWLNRTPPGSLTSQSCSGSRRRGGPLRCARRAGITCRCLGRLGRVRRCWRNGFPPYCRVSTRPPRWKSQPYTLWREPCRPRFRC